MEEVGMIIVNCNVVRVAKCSFIYLSISIIYPFQVSIPSCIIICTMHNINLFFLRKQHNINLINYMSGVLALSTMCRVQPVSDCSIISNGKIKRPFSLMLQKIYQTLAISKFSKCQTIVKQKYVGVVCFGKVQFFCVQLCEEDYRKL